MSTELRRLVGLVIAFASLGVIAACSTLDLAQDALSTVTVFGRQTRERGSFLGTSTEIFYPNGVPESIAELPQLQENQRLVIEHDVQRQADLLVGVLHRRNQMISDFLGLPILEVGHQVVHVTQFDLPEAALQEDNSIRIDMRVIQAVYRGILLSVTGAQNSSEVTQKQALQKVIDTRRDYLRSSPSPTVGMTVAAVRSGGSLFEREVASLDAELTQADNRSDSKKASDGYDDALAFILGHELGHRALDHFKRLADGSSRRDLEAEADRFGALLVVIGRNDSVSPRSGYLFSPPSGPFEYYQINGGRYCPLEYNHRPTGHESFFKYGYSLAGFDSLGKATKDVYPPLAERFAGTSRITVLVYKPIDWAQDDLGNCSNSSQERAEYRKDPQRRFRAHIDDATDTLEGKIKELAIVRELVTKKTGAFGEPLTDKDLRRETAEARDLSAQTRDLQDVIGDQAFAEKVYLLFFIRMSGRTAH
jgi:hypothetical protein